MFRKGVPWGGTVDYSYPVQPAEIDTIQVAKDQMDLDGYTYFSDSAIPAISIYNKYLTNEEILSRFENQKGLHINADCFTPWKFVFCFIQTNKVNVDPLKTIEKNIFGKFFI